ncbi:MAG: hypothetical protein ABL970_12050 [Nitrospira sp.]
MLKASKASVAKSTGIDCCHRCGGLMVSEPVHELASYDWRCISCGERIDPVILAHRRQECAHSKGEKIGASRGQLALS